MAINTEYQGLGEQKNGNGGAIHHASKMVDEAKAFKEAVGKQAHTINQSIDLSGRVQRNPLAMVAVAAGVGYVLGGGLFSPMTGRLLKLGLRLAVIPLVKSQLSGIAAAAMKSATPRGAPGEGSAGSTF